MERHQIIEMMRELKLAGMRGAFDEILANGLKRQHSIPQIIGDLLRAEIAEFETVAWTRGPCLERKNSPQVVQSLGLIVPPRQRRQTSRSHTLAALEDPLRIAA